MKGMTMKSSVRSTMKWLIGILLVLNVLGTIALPLYAAERADEGAAAAPPATAAAPAGADLNTIAVALVVGLSCIGAAYAVACVGSAAVGAVSEKSELFGRLLVFVGLAEGIAIYGVVIGLLILFR